MNKALILLNLQVDYAPGGSTPIAGAGDLVAVANRLMEKFPIAIASREWHPSNHISFAITHQGRLPGDLLETAGPPIHLRPVHCARDAAGAAFLPGLDMDKLRAVIDTGTFPDIDDYSAFFDLGHAYPTRLGEYLSEESVEEIFIMGVPLETTVQNTALDGVKMGFIVNVIVDACRGNDQPPGTMEQVLRDLQDAGINLLSEAEVMSGS
jgi:nicotinamidase/pyrazinamidase